MRIGCEAACGAGATAKTDDQKISAEVRKSACSPACTVSFARAASYSGEKCATYKTATNCSNATNGFVKMRTALEESTRASAAAGLAGVAASSSRTGAPISSSGAATEISTRCCTMCQVSDAS